MPSSNLIIQSFAQIVQNYAPEDRVIQEIRDNRGAFNIGDNNEDTMRYNTFRSFRLSASGWVDSQIRKFVNKVNIPIGLPVPVEIEGAAVAKALQLIVDRTVGSNRPEDGDPYAISLKEEADGYIESFIANLEDYPELVGNKVQIRTTPAVISQDKVLFEKVGIDNHREVSKDNTDVDQPQTLNKTQNLNDAQGQLP